MFQKFNTDTLESRFIKNLIYNTPLPIYRTIVVGDWISSDCTYVYKRNIIKCNSSGYFMSGEPTAKYTIVKDYEFGRYYPTITEKCFSPNAYYDHSTHEMLGKYLRCYRDIFGINLLPFYNCFSGYYTDYFHLENSHYVSGVNNAYKVALFPIRYNTKYTIALDCSTDVSITPLILNNEIPVTVLLNGQYTNLSSLLLNSAVIKSNCSFKKPFTYSVDTHTAEGEEVNYVKYLQQNENHLCLAIQIPVSNISSIVVLEGEYLNLDTDRILEKHSMSSLPEEYLNKILLSPLSLLTINDRNNYAFSDKLLEYLTLNTITSEENIENNITLVQDALGLNAYIDVTPGVWNDVIRYESFYFYKNNYSSDPRLRFADINGFTDKNIEKLILKGSNNG